MMYGYSIKFSVNAKKRKKRKKSKWKKQGQGRKNKNLLARTRNYRLPWRWRQMRRRQQRKPVLGRLTSRMFFVPTMTKPLLFPVKIYQAEKEEGNDTTPSTGDQEEYPILQNGTNRISRSRTRIPRTNEKTFFMEKKDTMLLFSNKYKSSDSTDEMINVSTDGPNSTSDSVENADHKQGCYISSSGTLCMSEDMYPIFVEWYNFLKQNNSSFKRNFQFFGKVKPVMGSDDTECNELTSATTTTTYKTNTGFESEITVHTCDTQRYPSFVSYGLKSGIKKRIPSTERKISSADGKRAEVRRNPSRCLRITEMKETMRSSDIGQRRDDEKYKTIKKLVINFGKKPSQTVVKTVSRGDSAFRANSVKDAEVETNEVPEKLNKYTEKINVDNQAKPDTINKYTDMEHGKFFDTRPKITLKSKIRSKSSTDEKYALTPMQKQKIKEHHEMSKSSDRSKELIKSTPSSRSYLIRTVLSCKSTSENIESIKTDEDPLLSRRQRSSIYSSRSITISKGDPTKQRVITPKTQLRSSRSYIDRFKQVETLKMKVEEKKSKQAQYKTTIMGSSTTICMGSRVSSTPKKDLNKKLKQPDTRKPSNSPTSRIPCGLLEKKVEKHEEKVKAAKDIREKSKKEEHARYEREKRSRREMYNSQSKTQTYSIVDLKKISEIIKEEPEYKQEKKATKDNKVVSNKRTVAKVGDQKTKKGEKPPSPPKEYRGKKIIGDETKNKIDGDSTTSSNADKEKKKFVRRNFSFFKRSENITVGSSPQKDKEKELTKRKKEEGIQKNDKKKKKDKEKSDQKEEKIKRENIVKTTVVMNVQEAPKKNSKDDGHPKKEVASTSTGDSANYSDIFGEGSSQASQEVAKLVSLITKVSNVDTITSEYIFKQIEKDWNYWEKLLLLDKLTKRINMEETMLQKELLKYQTLSHTTISSQKEPHVGVIPIFYNTNIGSITDSEQNLGESNKSSEKRSDFVLSTTTTSSQTEAEKEKSKKQQRSNSKSKGDTGDSVQDDNRPNSSVYSFIKKFLMCIKVSSTPMEPKPEEKVPTNWETSISNLTTVPDYMSTTTLSTELLARVISSEDFPVRSTDADKTDKKVRIATTIKDVRTKLITIPRMIKTKGTTGLKRMKNNVVFGKFLWNPKNDKSIPEDPDAYFKTTEKMSLTDMIEVLSMSRKQADFQGSPYMQQLPFQTTVQVYGATAIYDRAEKLGVTDPKQKYPHTNVYADRLFLAYKRHMALKAGMRRIDPKEPITPLIPMLDWRRRLKPPGVPPMYTNVGVRVKADSSVLKMHLPTREICMEELGWLNEDAVEERHLDTPKFEKILKCLAAPVQYEVGVSPEELKLVTEMTEDIDYNLREEEQVRQEVEDFMRVSLGSADSGEEEEEEDKLKRRRRKKKPLEGSQSAASTTSGDTSSTAYDPEESKRSVISRDASVFEPDYGRFGVQELELPPPASFKDQPVAMTDLEPLSESEPIPEPQPLPDVEHLPTEERSSEFPYDANRAGMTNVPVPIISVDGDAGKELKKPEDDLGPVPDWEPSKHMIILPEGEDPERELPGILPKFKYVSSRRRRRSGEPFGEEEGSIEIEEVSDIPPGYDALPRRDSSKGALYRPPSGIISLSPTPLDGEADRLSGRADGQSGRTDGQSGPTDGQSGPTDGQSGRPDGQSGRTDGQSGPTDGQSGLTDGQSGPTDGQSGRTDGRSGPIDGQSGRTDGQPEVVLVDLDETEEVDCDCGNFRVTLKRADKKEFLEHFKISYQKNRLELTAPSVLRKALNCFGGCKSTQTAEDGDKKRPGGEEDEEEGELESEDRAAHSREILNDIIKRISTDFDEKASDGTPKSPPKTSTTSLPQTSTPLPASKSSSTKHPRRKSSKAQKPCMSRLSSYLSEKKDKKGKWKICEETGQQTPFEEKKKAKEAKIRQLEEKEAAAKVKSKEKLQRKISSARVSSLCDSDECEQLRIKRLENEIRKQEAEKKKRAEKKRRLQEERKKRKEEKKNNRPMTIPQNFSKFLQYVKTTKSSKTKQKPIKTKLPKKLSILPWNKPCKTKTTATQNNKIKLSKATSGLRTSFSSLKCLKKKVDVNCIEICDLEKDLRGAKDPASTVQVVSIPSNIGFKSYNLRFLQIKQSPMSKKKKFRKKRRKVTCKPSSSSSRKTTTTTTTFEGNDDLGFNRYPQHCQVQFMHNQENYYRKIRGSLPAIRLTRRRQTDASTEVNNLERPPVRPIKKSKKKGGISKKEIEKMVADVLPRILNKTKINNEAKADRAEQKLPIQNLEYHEMSCVRIPQSHDSSSVISEDFIHPEHDFAVNTAEDILLSILDIVALTAVEPKPERSSDSSRQLSDDSFAFDDLTTTTTSTESPVVRDAANEVVIALKNAEMSTVETRAVDLIDKGCSTTQENSTIVENVDVGTICSHKPTLKESSPFSSDELRCIRGLLEAEIAEVTRLQTPSTTIPPPMIQPPRIPPCKVASPITSTIPSPPIPPPPIQPPRSKRLNPTISTSSTPSTTITPPTIPPPTIPPPTVPSPMIPPPMIALPITPPPITSPPIPSAPISPPPLIPPPILSPPITPRPITQPPITQPPITRPPMTPRPMIPPTTILSTAIAPVRIPTTTISHAIVTRSTHKIDIVDPDTISIASSVTLDSIQNCTIAAEPVQSGVLAAQNASSVVLRVIDLDELAAPPDTLTFTDSEDTTKDVRKDIIPADESLKNIKEDSIEKSAKFKQVPVKEKEVSKEVAATDEFLKPPPFKSSTPKSLNTTMPKDLKYKDDKDKLKKCVETSKFQKIPKPGPQVKSPKHNKTTPPTIKDLNIVDSLELIESANYGLNKISPKKQWERKVSPSRNADQAKQKLEQAKKPPTTYYEIHKDTKKRKRVLKEELVLVEDSNSATTKSSSKECITYKTPPQCSTEFLELLYKHKLLVKVLEDLKQNTLKETNEDLIVKTQEIKTIKSDTTKGDFEMALRHKQTDNGANVNKIEEKLHKIKLDTSSSSSNIEKKKKKDKKEKEMPLAPEISLEEKENEETFSSSLTHSRITFTSESGSEGEKQIREALKKISKPKVTEIDNVSEYFDKSLFEITSRSTSKTDVIQQSRSSRQTEMKTDTSLENVHQVNVLTTSYMNYGQAHKVITRELAKHKNPSMDTILSSSLSSEDSSHEVFELAGGLRYYYIFEEDEIYKDTKVQVGDNHSLTTREEDDINWDVYKEDVFDNSIYERGSTHSKYEQSCAVQISPKPIFLAQPTTEMLAEKNKQMKAIEVKEQRKRLERKLSKPKPGLTPEQRQKRKRKIQQLLKKLAKAEYDMEPAGSGILRHTSSDAMELEHNIRNYGKEEEVNEKTRKQKPRKEKKAKATKTYTQELLKEKVQAICDQPPIIPLPELPPKRKPKKEDSRRPPLDIEARRELFEKKMSTKHEKIDDENAKSVDNYAKKEAKERKRRETTTVVNVETVSRKKEGEASEKKVSQPVPVRKARSSRPKSKGISQSEFIVNYVTPRSTQRVADVCRPSSVDPKVASTGKSVNASKFMKMMSKPEGSIASSSQFDVLDLENVEVFCNELKPHFDSIPEHTLESESVQTTLSSSHTYQVMKNKSACFHEEKPVSKSDSREIGEILKLFSKLLKLMSGNK